MEWEYEREKKRDFLCVRSKIQKGRAREIHTKRERERERERERK